MFTKDSTDYSSSGAEVSELQNDMNLQSYLREKEENKKLKQRLENELKEKNDLKEDNARLYSHLNDDFNKIESLNKDIRDLDKKNVKLKARNDKLVRKDKLLVESVTKTLCSLLKYLSSKSSKYAVDRNFKDEVYNALYEYDKSLESLQKMNDLILDIRYSILNGLEKEITERRSVIEGEIQLMNQKRDLIDEYVQTQIDEAAILRSQAKIDIAALRSQAEIDIAALRSRAKNYIAMQNASLNAQKEEWNLRLGLRKSAIVVKERSLNGREKELNYLLNKNYDSLEKYKSALESAKEDLNRREQCIKSKEEYLRRKQEDIELKEEYLRRKQEDIELKEEYLRRKQEYIELREEYLALIPKVELKGIEIKLEGAIDFRKMHVNYGNSMDLFSVEKDHIMNKLLIDGINKCSSINPKIGSLFIENKIEYKTDVDIRDR